MSLNLEPCSMVYSGSRLASAFITWDSPLLSLRAQKPQLTTAILAQEMTTYLNTKLIIFHYNICPKAKKTKEEQNGNSRLSAAHSTICQVLSRGFSLGCVTSTLWVYTLTVFFVEGGDRGLKSLAFFFSSFPSYWMVNSKFKPIVDPGGSMEFPWYGNDVHDKEMWVLGETDNYFTWIYWTKY